MLHQKPLPAACQRQIQLPVHPDGIRSHGGLYLVALQGLSEYS